MKKRAITLLEIMIVILLIGIIGSVLGYNMKGSLDKGKAFKTRQAQEQIKSILLLQAAEKELSLKELIQEPRQYLLESNLVKDVDKLLKDGWGVKMDITIRPQKDDQGNDIPNTEELVVISDRLNEYDQQNK